MPDVSAISEMKTANTLHRPSFSWLILALFLLGFAAFLWPSPDKKAAKFI